MPATRLAPDAAVRSHGVQDPDTPALLVAASLHRSGSTLVQRYVTAAIDTFMWGENGQFVQALRDAYESWPSKAHEEVQFRQAMDDPSVTQLYAPRPPGFTQWGWKDVGYGEADIIESITGDVASDFGYARLD